MALEKTHFLCDLRFSYMSDDEENGPGGLCEFDDESLFVNVWTTKIQRILRTSTRHAHPLSIKARELTGYHQNHFHSPTNYCAWLPPRHECLGLNVVADEEKGQGLCHVSRPWKSLDKAFKNVKECDHWKWLEQLWPLISDVVIERLYPSYSNPGVLIDQHGCKWDLASEDDKPLFQRAAQRAWALVRQSYWRRLVAVTTTSTGLNYDTLNIVVPYLVPMTGELDHPIIEQDSGSSSSSGHSLVME